ncbi:MAG TPA: trehalose-phosphatase [Rhizomicrobium sp.]|nr:trehalose-phosphatase [Rhizomicrobium sp.]
MAIFKDEDRPVQAPAPQSDWALFLDIDGTLLDIAPRPEDVHVPKGLIDALARASAWLGGALAIVSGRPFAQIDKLFAPLRLPGGAGHGSALRLPDGTTQSASDSYSVPEEWRTVLNESVKTWRGVTIEEKAHSVTIHYRAAPERKEDLKRIVDGIVARDPESFEAMPGRKAIEIRHRALTKAVIVRNLMAHVPFKGRIPVFVGDDVTDHDGFRAVEELGGIALHVAEAFDGRPAAVRAWLKRFHTEDTD